MKKKSKIKTRITFKEFFKRISGFHLFLFLMLPLTFIFLIYMNFSLNYSRTSENIKYRAEATLLRYAVEMDDFLQPYVKLMEYISYNVNDMVRRGENVDDIEAYLTRETQYIIEAQEGDTTGVYGYICRKYLDGSGWEPELGYVPTARPWYIMAKDNKGDITYVRPYIDSMTGDRIMTIAKLLSDGESVVAVDVKINTLQDITERLQINDEDTDFVIVLDKNGNVITHSDPKMVGRNYIKTESEPDHTIAAKLLQQGMPDYTVERNGVKEVVYSRGLGGGWYVLSIMNESRTMAGLYSAVRDSILIGLLGTILIFFLLYTIVRRSIETENYMIDLNSVSGIYICMYKIDLKEDTFEEINNTSKRISELVGDRHDDASNLIREVNIRMTDERTREELLEFVDLSTLNERMRGHKTITVEFMNSNQVWNRARFITAERDSDESLKSVLYMVEVIDKERRDRDRLIYMSEIDSMTGINNRGTGENKVKQALLTGDGGMFIFMDVDQFKSINDTFGHDVGDKVLIAIADCLKRTFRNDDIIMRLGGDEFAAFAPLVFDYDGGSLIVERLIHQVGEIKIPEIEDRNIEISVGVAFYRPNDQFAFDELYKRADMCTYESKKHSGSFAIYYDSEVGGLIVGDK